MNDFYYPTNRMPVPIGIYDAALILSTCCERDERFEPLRVAVTEWVGEYDTPRNAAIRVLKQAATYGIQRVCVE